MNKDQVKGKAKEVGGKIQEKVGDAVGSSEQKLKGMKNQAEGNIQQKAGDVKEVVKDRGNR
ncbi:MAG TPA: CsbD family protein [Telluria sp.]